MNLKTFFVTEEDGVRREYLKFGNYPCNVVSDEKLIENLNNIESYSNLGNSTYECIEFQRNIYCRINISVSKVFYIPRKEKFSPHFENGKIINNGIYYFTVEPIIWHVLRNDNNRLLLCSKKILGTLPMENHLFGINRINDDLRQLNSMQNKNYRLINLRKQQLNESEMLQCIDFQKKYDDFFASIAFSKEELSLIVKTQEELSLYRSLNKEMKKNEYKVSKNVVATDFARATNIMFSVKEKNEGIAPYWFIEFNKDLKMPFVCIHNPFILYGPTTDIQVGIRPIIEVCATEETVTENKKIEEEIIKENIQKNVDAIEYQKFLLSEVDSICFQQIKPEPAPVFSGFIPMCLMLTIIGIPIAFIYGMIRGIIQNSKIEKYVPKENAIEITKDKKIRFYSDDSFKELNINDISHYHFSQKQFNSVNLVPSTYNTKTCSYGKVIIYTKNKNKYVIENILFPKGVSKLLENYNSEWMVEKLLKINNDQLVRIKEAISLYDSGIFNDFRFENTISEILNNK